MKISFFLINMNLGGTEKAFLNFADELLNLGYDLELVLLENDGELINDIPKEVNVIVLNYTKVKALFEDSPKKNLINYLKNLKFRLFLLYFFKRIINYKFFKNKFSFYKWLSKKIIPQELSTDIAIAFAGPHELISYMIREKVNAKKKFQWIHFDINEIYFDQSFYSKILTSFDKIFVVSNFVKEQLINSQNDFINKIELFYNILPSKKILALAKEGEDYNDDYRGIRILSIGRATYEKGFDIAVETAKLLKEQNIYFKWYLIGDGSEQEIQIQKSKLLNLENEVIFLGEQGNPYTYLKNCDIYVQPSRQEGFGITVSEAKIFNKPIVVTNIPGFREQIQHKTTGYICEDIKAENLQKGIEYFLNRDNRILVSSNLENSNHANVFGVKEFLKLLH